MSDAPRPAHPAKIRRGRMSDLPALMALEQVAFTTDHLSRRSLRHFLAAPTATLIVAEGADQQLAGYAIVFYPPHSQRARLYSIAVAPHFGGRGLGPLLLSAAENAAILRGRRAMRLEVHESNKRAIARYEKSGYGFFGKHHDYYDDHGDALRFEKPLDARHRRPRPAVGHALE